MQFDVHRNLGRGAERGPYLFDLQSDRVESLRLRVVAPLVLTGFLTGVPRLNPQFTIEGRTCVLSTAEHFAMDPRQLGPVVENLTPLRHRIIAALDLLFTGI